VQQPIALKKNKIAAVMSSRTAAMENLQEDNSISDFQQTTSSDCSVGTHYDSRRYSRSAVYN
jgi:hypothetical protein